MKKARIVIADADVNYVMALQSKWIEQFYDKVNLEIITDKNYYNEFFMTHQKIDILIVSEDLYDLSVRRHNINSVFILSEDDETNIETNAYTKIIYKYSSIKEIINTVQANSDDILSFEENEGNKTQVILVTSAAGGVGKTTVAIGLAASFAEESKVLYMNSEKIHSFQHLLKDKTSVSGNIYMGLLENQDMEFEEIKEYIRNESFDYIPPFRASLLSLGIKPDIYKKLIERAKMSKEYDYIIVDSDNVFDENKVNMMEMADKVIVVTKTNRASIMATKNLLQNINGMTADKYKIIANDCCTNMNFENDLLMQDFFIDEYVENISDYEEKEIKDFSHMKSMQKIKYLLF